MRVSGIAAYRYYDMEALGSGCVEQLYRWGVETAITT